MPPPLSPKVIPAPKSNGAATHEAAADFKETIEFLKQLRPSGPWVLVAIVPDGSPTATTAHNTDAVRKFASTHNGKKNLYFSVNPTRAAVNKKASKADIAAIEYLHADLDPNPDEKSDDAKKRYLDALKGYDRKASLLIDSGNGVQALWRLNTPIVLGKPVDGFDDNGKPCKVLNAADKPIVDDIEDRSAAIMTSLGGDPVTRNIDRIFRLPGTINLPNAKKTKEGRTRCLTKLLDRDDASYQLEDFPKPTIPSSDNPDLDDLDTETIIDWAKVEEHKDWLKSVDDLPSDFPPKGKIIVGHSPNDTITDLNTDLKRAGLIEKNYGSWNSVTLALAAIFKTDGRFTIEQIAAALMCDLECNQHIKRQKDKRRAINRALDRAYEPLAKRVARALPWRECRIDGRPVASMHNARLAITALNIECRYDTFHNKLFFGYRGDRTQHQLQFVDGEVSDNGIISLRQKMSDRFGFDLGDRATRDAVVSLALDHCFDPVCDMLDKAQAEWDGVERLDRMAVDYFNCDDTQFNRAAIRKTIIAMVRRARHPGCKFDTIVVLESEEGLNKSTAWRVLAGDDNFSDESILGKQGREVQEQLAEVWIHENADLAGMKKADVDHIKAFASRQIDIARPAYGHFTKKQARHSIEVGTTNNSEYLQSQTGNRRFWPLTVRKMIDTNVLQHDRLQLLGEAAHYESQGESITLDEILWPAAAEEQEKRRTKDAWEDVLDNMPTHYWLDQYGRPQLEWLKEGEHGYNHYAKIIHKDFDRELVTSVDLLTYVLGIPIGQQTTFHSMRLATVMKRVRWERCKATINGQQARGYFRQVKPTEGKPT